MLQDLTDKNPSKISSSIEDLDEKYKFWFSAEMGSMPPKFACSLSLIKLPRKVHRVHQSVFDATHSPGGIIEQFPHCGISGAALQLHLHATGHRLLQVMSRHVVDFLGIPHLEERDPSPGGECE